MASARPIRHIEPPRRVRSTAVCTVSGRPTHSYTRSAPNPWVSSLAVSPASSPGVTATSTPSERASVRRASLGSITITRPAPPARAHWAVSSPIGPAPWTMTKSPNVSPLLRTAWKVTVAGSTWAASIGLSPGSARMTRPAWTPRRGANPPWGAAPTPAPICVISTALHVSACPATQASQRPHAGGTATTTSSPSVRPVTSPPTAESVPNHSCPQMAGLYRAPAW